MKTFRIYACATGAVLASAGIFLAACGSDDTVVTAPPADAGPDTLPPEASPPRDSGGGTDAGDSGSADAGLKAPTYAETIAEAMCNALTNCCFGNANVPEGGVVDGGTFDRPKCLALYKDLGFEASNDGFDEVDAGNVTLDQTKGADCLQKINTLACELTGTAMQQIRTACFGALTGKVTTGQPCERSIECAPGNFCLLDADGGATGTCTALRTSGQNCSIVESGSDDSDAFTAEEACSFRGSGGNGFHCDSYDYGAGAYRPRNEWTCQPNVANGQGCNLSAWCADGICDPTDGAFVCKSPLDYFSKYSCAAHVNP